MSSAKRRYFGTDGVRGPVGGPQINAEFVARLSYAATRWMLQNKPAGDARTDVVIGRDTRASGEWLEAAVAAGISAAGGRPVSLGIVPSPAVARVVRVLAIHLGVVITASHNPASDNGIKFFGRGGIKLSDGQEADIESLIPEKAIESAHVQLPSLDAVSDYCAAAKSVLPAGSLRGWKIVVDTANGATCQTSPAVLRSLGADVEGIGDTPDGSNINDGVGSQHPDKLAARVRETGAALGVAQDGDGDRCILCDETGSILDGDEILVILATHALRRGTLRARTLVVTQQSNLGVDRAIREADGRVCRTAIGDRYVSERMLVEGSNLGGESSGHIVCSDISHSGDGLVAALKVIEVMLETGQPLSTLRLGLRKFPQRLRALRVREKKPLETLPRLWPEMGAIEKELGEQGRILVRYSGTEAVLRLLVEGASDSVVASVMERLEKAAGADLDLLGA